VVTHEIEIENGIWFQGYFIYCELGCQANLLAITLE